MFHLSVPVGGGGLVNLLGEVSIVEETSLKIPMTSEAPPLIKAQSKAWEEDKWGGGGGGGGFEWKHVKETKEENEVPEACLSFSLVLFNTGGDVLH